MIDHLHGKWVSFKVANATLEGKLLTSAQGYLTLQRSSGKRFAVALKDVEGTIEEIPTPGTTECP